jgi:hypothetical protein
VLRSGFALSSIESLPADLRNRLAEIPQGIDSGTARRMLADVLPEVRAAARAHSRLRHILMMGDIGPTFLDTPLVRAQPAADELRIDEPLWVKLEDVQHPVAAWKEWQLHPERHLGLFFGERTGSEGPALFDRLSAATWLPAKQLASETWNMQIASFDDAATRWLSVLHDIAERQVVPGLSAVRQSLPPMFPDRRDRIGRLKGLTKVAVMMRGSTARWSAIEPGLFKALSLALSSLIENHRSERASGDHSVTGNPGRVVLRRPIPICDAARQLNVSNLLRKLRNAHSLIDEASTPRTVELDDLLRCYPKRRKALLMWADQVYPAGG